MKLRESPTMPENIRSIYNSCVVSLASPTSVGSISLVLPGMRPAHQTVRYLAGRRSPKGEIVCNSGPKQQVVAFKTLDLLAWMTALGFLEMTE